MRLLRVTRDCVLEINIGPQYLSLNIEVVLISEVSKPIEVTLSSVVIRLDGLGFDQELYFDF